MRVLGLNAVFHDSSAAIVVDGEIVAAAEEERFTRRKHGKVCVPFSSWELPEQSARFCLERARVAPEALDAVAYSYDPSLAADLGADLRADEYEGLRTFYARAAPSFLHTIFPNYDPAVFRFVPHHVAHAASAYLAAPYSSCAVLVADGRGERTSYLAGVARDGDLTTLATQALPHSLGLRYEDLTVHLGFARSSDEYKVMGLAAYGTPRYLARLRDVMYVEGLQFHAPPIDFASFCPARPRGAAFEPAHADLAASVQRRLEEMLLELSTNLHRATGERRLAMAGGVALNCVANGMLAERGPFEEIWVQPAAGDAGTSLGAALFVAHGGGDRVRPMQTAALGRDWSDDELGRIVAEADLDVVRPGDIAASVAGVLARDGVVAWFQGRSEFGPRALGHRSLLAHPGYAANLERLNAIKGREEFRPVAPMVLADRAAELFHGQLPSPYMLFTHQVDPTWRERLAAVTHVDGTARVQTVDDGQPLVARMLRAFAERTGTPVVVNTSFNTAGRPMVDDPRDALECFASAPIDVLALGPFLLERRGARAAQSLAYA